MEKLTAELIADTKNNPPAHTLQVLPMVESKEINPAPLLHNQRSQETCLMSEFTLPKSTVSSNSTERDQSLNLKSSLLSPAFSTMTKVLPQKREHNPSSCILPKSKRLKFNQEEREDLPSAPGEMTQRLRWPKSSDLNSMSPLEENLVMEGQRSHLTQTTMNPERRGSCINQICPGMDDEGIEKFQPTQVASSLPDSSGSSIEISSQQNCLLDSHLTHLEEYPCRNGNISSRENLLTSTKCSLPSIALRLIRRERLALERQRLVLEELKQSGRWRQVLNGLSHGDPLRERLLSFLGTKRGSLRSTVTTSSDSSQLRDPVPMDKSFCLIKGSGTKLEEVKPCCLPIINTSPLFTPPRCKMMASSTIGVGEEEEVGNQEMPRVKCASGSTAKMVAGLRSQHVNINIPANPAVKPVTENLPVERGIEDQIFGMRPRYLRHNLWTPDSDPKMTAADWTLIAQPLPRPPVEEFNNLPALQSLRDRPDLFKIVTPINVDVFEELLAAHPNRRFVESVMDGLRYGFWPWANTRKEGYPVTLDESKPIRFDDEKKQFIARQLAHERELGRVSDVFRGELLPGMYCMPHYVVPKPHSSGWRLVNDLSYGKFSPNSMVDHQCVTGYPLDNLSHLGEMLLRKRKERPGVKFVAWKSDVAEAYRICPMHELWQLKQVVKVEDGFCVDRVDMFGGSGSGPIFISVNSLAAWVAKYERLLEDLVYVDDSFGIDEEGNLVWYTRYEEELPAQQAQLLSLWDELGIPHKQAKQVHGPQLMILGIMVDVNELTFTLPPESKERLSKELAEWCRKGVRRKVKEWQQLAGWINWVLNIYPLLRPALNNIYAKIKGKDQEARVWANNAMREDMVWAKQRVDVSSGVRLLKSFAWEVEEATCVAKTDACPRGLAFWYPDQTLGFASHTPNETPATQIAFYEALAVLSVLNDARSRFPPESKIVVYSDNFTTVAMFNTLRALPEYNCILKAAVDILVDHGFRLRVLHVAGASNDVADALSRGDFMRALRLQPSLIIRAFEPFVRIDRHQSPPMLRPPRQTLGAVAC